MIFGHLVPRDGELVAEFLDDRFDQFDRNVNGRIATEYDAALTVQDRVYAFQHVGSFHTAVHWVQEEEDGGFADVPQDDCPSLLG